MMENSVSGFKIIIKEQTKLINFKKHAFLSGNLQLQSSREFKSLMFPGLPLYEGSLINKRLHIRYVFYFSNMYVPLFMENSPPCQQHLCRTH